MDINNIPLSDNDIILCDMDVFGIEVVIRAKYLGICKETNRIIFQLDDARYENMSWYDKSHRKILPEFVIDVVEHLAPTVPEIFD